ncbi:histidinol-phosphate transaminase [Marininema halotolerans]|uniref:Histidinol-phosphate aminotransferase n=1 Tax=Marininema halotolerans TaxID=1155944 RepID=A0A1I6TZH8_9BACL|nr:histidinol-phosphate transaminase [Marininema halotolerans]SFS94601.1 histidinol-phosphate aminotransferase [Marininema halotolerans]
MKGKATLQGVPVYQPGKPLEEVKREYGLDEVIKLASNENPLGCSPNVWESLQAERDFFALYPEGEAPLLKEKLAAHLQIEPQRLMFGNGSDEIIQMIGRTFLEPGDETVMADITFPRYKTQTLIEGGKAVEVPLIEGVHDLEGMAAALNERTRIVWICNPNNPTGTMISGEELTSFMKKVPPHVLVVLDEAYEEYVVDSNYPDGIHEVLKDPRVIVLRTFSKIYGLAAFRIGYGVMDPRLIQEMNRVREPFNVNRLAQRAAVAGLEDQDFVKKCRDTNREGLALFEKQLNKWNLSYFPSQGNFILMDTERDANEVFQALLAKGMIIRSGVPLGYPTHIRVTIGTREQNLRFLTELAQILDKPAPEDVDRSHE